jgi:hypothetical protein
VIVCLLLVTCGLGVTAWREHLELVRLRASATELQIRQRELSANHERFKRLEPLKAAVVPSERFLPVPAPVPSTASTTSTTSASVDDPYTIRLMEGKMRAMIQRKYAGLFAQLNIPQDQIDKLTNLLVDKKNAEIDVAAGTVQQGVDLLNDPVTVNVAVQGERNDIENEIQALLGDTAYAQYCQYASSLAQQTVVGKLQQSLAASAAPLLTSVQSQLLAQTLAQSQTVQVTPAVLSQAQDFLSQSQIQVLQQLQQEKQNRFQLIRQEEQRAVGGGTPGQ